MGTEKEFEIRLIEFEFESREEFINFRLIVEGN